VEHLAISIRFVSSTALGISNGGASECGRGANGDWTVLWGIKGSIGSLKNLTALKSLEIPLPLLLDWYVNQAKPLAELLSDSLVELRFRADLSHWGLFKWDVLAVLDLIDCYATCGKRGSLRIIQYMLLEEGITDNEAVLERMRETCSGVGIRFETMRIC